MAECWIVSGYAFFEHTSPSKAMSEAQRLAAKEGKPFRVYRVRESMTVPEGVGAGRKSKLKVALADQSKSESNA